jgi:hypothetical protein
MSKKKNTLKDLDEFLKQQAASLVTPDPVIANDPERVVPPTDYSPGTDAREHVTTDMLYKDLVQLSQENPDSFRQKFYALIIQVLEAQPSSLPEDKMMINTALYLKSGDHWKEAIRDYWKKTG